MDYKKKYIKYKLKYLNLSKIFNINGGAFVTKNKIREKYVQFIEQLRLNISDRKWLLEKNNIYYDTKNMLALPDTDANKIKIICNYYTHLINSIDPTNNKYQQLIFNLLLNGYINLDFLYNNFYYFLHIFNIMDLNLTTIDKNIISIKEQLLTKKTELNTTSQEIKDLIDGKEKLITTMRESTMRESAMRESTMRESAMRESAMRESAMRESAMKETTMRDSTERSKGDEVKVGELIDKLKQEIAKLSNQKGQIALSALLDTPTKTVNLIELEEQIQRKKSEISQLKKQNTEIKSSKSSNKTSVKIRDTAIVQYDIDILAAYERDTGYKMIDNNLKLYPYKNCIYILNKIFIFYLIHILSKFKITEVPPMLEIIILL